MDIIFTAILLFIGFIYGSRAEKKHIQSIIKREQELKYLPVRTDQLIGEQITSVLMVSGTAVVANDYFKTFVAEIKNTFGGRLTSYESLLDRARREATIRLKEQAVAWGAKEIVHLRIESGMLDKLGVEVFAVATAVK